MAISAQMGKSKDPVALYFINPTTNWITMIKLPPKNASLICCPKPWLLRSAPSLSPWTHAIRSKSQPQPHHDVLGGQQEPQLGQVLVVSAMATARDYEQPGRLVQYFRLAP